MPVSEEQFIFNSSLDREFLDSIYEGDREHAEMIFEKFLGSIEGQLGEIEAGFQLKDIEQFRTKLHKLKPLLSFVGLTALTNQAETIEKKCKIIDDISLVDAAYESFRDELKSMLPLIENELLRLKA